MSVLACRSCVLVSTVWVKDENWELYLFCPNGSVKKKTSYGNRAWAGLVLGLGIVGYRF